MPPQRYDEMDVDDEIDQENENDEYDEKVMIKMMIIIIEDNRNFVITLWLKKKINFRRKINI